MKLLIGASTVLTVYIGGLGVVKGTITAGNIAEFVIYVNMLTWPVTALGWISSIIQQAAASQKRINEFLSEKPSVKNHTTEETPIRGKITFENLSYTYPDTNITALKDISFTVNPGETLSIIGHTGSGKSTILELIGRLYDVEKGIIKIDETPIKELNLDNLRSSIGYVPQDAFLFSDSIKNNIRFGKEDADETSK